MLAFSSPVLLMCVRTRYKVSDSDVTKKGVKPLIFTTPITLHGKNLVVKQPLNKTLKLTKIFEHLKFITKQIDPREFTIIIDKANIVFLATKRINGRTPHI
jgi:hypothetical protein